MKNLMIFLLPFIFLISSMSSTRIVQHTDSSDQEVNQELNGKTVTLVKVD